MLNILPNSHQFPRKAELLLNGIPRRNLARCSIRAEEIPGVESGEVLERAEELIAADSGRNELEVMSDRGMID